MLSLLLTLLFILVGIIGGLIGGMGGPTGFLVIAVLMTVTSLNNAEIAGTTSTMFTLATIIGSILYTISGDQDWKLIAMIVPTVVIGTRIGVYVNESLSPSGFNIIMAIIAIILGTLVIYDTHYGVNEKYQLTTDSITHAFIFGVLGLIVGLIGGITGLGGISILVPSLIVFGIPPLVAVSTAITQGVVVTSTTAYQYLSAGSVDFTYVLLIGVPFAVSQIIGWYFAHRINTANLKYILGIFQLLFGIYLCTTIV